jgi:hypothetical protein
MGRGVMSTPLGDVTSGNAMSSSQKKEDKAKVQSELTEPSSSRILRCYWVYCVHQKIVNLQNGKKAKSLATKKPHKENHDNSVCSLSADLFSTALDSDITQLNDRFDVFRQEKLAQSEF